MGNMNALEDPRKLALLNFGAGVLSQPYTNLPQGALAPFGRGIEQASTAYQNALILQGRQEELEEKKREKEAELAQQKAMQKQINTVIQSLPPNMQPLAAAMASNSPETFFKTFSDQIIGKQPLPALGAKDFSQDVREVLVGLFGYKEQYTPEEVARANSIADQEAMLRARAAGGSSLPPGAQSYVDLTAEQTAKRLAQYEEAAVGGYELKEIVNYTRELSNAVKTGGLGAEQITALQTAAQNLGLPSFESVDDTAAEQALVAASNRMINTLRQLNPADSQFTKPDLIFYMEQVPSLARTPEGRKLILEMLDMQAQRATDYGAKIQELQYDSPDISVTELNRKFMSYVRDRDKEMDSLLKKVRGHSDPDSSNVTSVRTGRTKDGRPVRQLSSGKTQVQNADGTWSDL